MTHPISDIKKLPSMEMEKFKKGAWNTPLKKIRNQLRKEIIKELKERKK